MSPDQPPVYVVSPRFSGVAGPFWTLAEAEAYAAAQDGAVIEARQVDPDIRKEAEKAHPRPQA